MSMPQFLSIVVISARVDSKGESVFSGDIASTAAAIIRGEIYPKQIAPNVIPVAINRHRHVSLVEFASSEKSLTLKKVVYPQSVNPQEIDVWLALDDEAVKLARERIKHDGPPPNGCYEMVFPDPVIHCGFLVPDPPIDLNYKAWLELMITKFTPWKERFWKAFRDSS